MKNTEIKIRCSFEDKEKYKKLANSNGLDLSAYIRFLLFRELKKGDDCNA